MLLGPQHLQAAERSARETVRLAEDWSVGYSYGLRHVEIDRDALANGRVLLPRCHARLRDGTQVRYPEDASLPPAAIPPNTFRAPSDRVTVHLAVPRLELGRGNAAPAGAESSLRYLVEPAETEDENQPGNPRPIEYRRLNAKLLIGDGGMAGYETLPICRLRLGETAEAPSEIDPDYIPPLLACDAWAPLQGQIIGGISDRLGSLSERLARQMIDRGVAFESGHKEDLERILKLHSVNAALGGVWNLPGGRGVHPFAAYSELCRAAGLMAVFRPERRLTDLPRYDHDDLARCFFALRTMFDFESTAKRDYVKKPFIGDGQRLRAILEPQWLGADWSFYVGIECELPVQAVDRLLMKELALKVASSNEVDAIFQGRLAGVPLSLVSHPPRDFPQATGGRQWSYWQADRSNFRWQSVEKTRDLGIRFNATQTEGELRGPHPVKIRQPDGRLVELSFALYAMPSA